MVTAVPGNHGAWPAMATTISSAIILAPFAYAQFGSIGPVIVFAFAIAVVLSVWCTAWGAAKLAARYPSLAALFASSGVRMVGPAVVALIVVLSHGRIAPLETVYYAIPLFLCGLVSDVIVWVHELGPLRRHPNGSGGESPVVGGGA